MLLLDRYLGFHFFTTDLGGNAMMYVNLIWAWGHPEVYILILPAFGVFSEVISTFSGKPLFGYRSMIIATMAICILSFLVWLHHFFTMGAGADVNGFFGIMTMIIAVPTGVKIFNWLFTMWGGRVRFETPMLWALAFMVTFVIGGMTGVLLAVPPADFVLHNSLFLVAHFHNVIIGGVLFGAFAGYTYWFPKAFGFKLDERWGKAAFWFWVVGFYVAFMPLYVLGLEGMTRRMQHYDVAGMAALADRRGRRRGADPRRHRLPDHAARRHRSAIANALRDLTGDPVGRPHARMDHRLAAAGLQLRRHAERHGRRGLLGHQAAGDRAAPAYATCPTTSRSRCRATARPASSSAFFAVVTGFALIWHIWWMVDRRARRRLRDLRRLRLARPFANTKCPAAELAEIDGQRREARVALVEGREPGITPVESRPPQRARSAQARRARRARWRPQGAGAEAHHHRLRLLGLPAVGLHHVLRLLRRLRGAVACDGRRPDGREQLFDLQDGGDRDRLPAAVELRLRHGDDRQQCPQHAVDAGLLSRSPACSASASSCWKVNEFAKMLARAPGPSAAPSCRRSSRWSAATACTSRSACSGSAR